MTFKKVEAILLSAIGLSAETVGKDVVLAAARVRMSARGLQDPGKYALLLSADREELQALIEAVVVSETWFFREPASFALLRERLAAKTPTGPVQVLCIPCATGEEPYSVVMTLLEAGHGAERIEVHGVDVSQNAMRIAELGRYGRNSFRGGMDGYAKYFEQRDGISQLSSEVRRAVQLRVGNVLDPKLFAGMKFHAVFCRNLLIYLDRPARAAALENLQRMLRPEGVLFVGHSEAGDVAAHGLQRTGDPRSFAFMAAGAKPSARAQARTPITDSRLRTPSLKASLAPGGSLARKPPSLRPRSPRPGSLRPGSLRPGPSHRTSTPTVEMLSQARLLADSGALEDAKTTCERALLYSPLNADLHSLLGIVQRALGDMRAARASFLQAVALDTTHHEALFHLGLLCESEGDLTAARNYRARAQASRSSP